MALAPGRQVAATNIDFALNAVQECGVIVSIIPGTTAVGEVAVTSPTGANVQPIGILLDDVEDMNYDRHGEYLQRNVVDVGSIVSLADEGEFWTDRVTGTPAAGDQAYLNVNGTVSPTQLTDGITAAPQVGIFLSALNANGFAKIRLDIA
jgi:hypothetical protein